MKFNDKHLVEIQPSYNSLFNQQGGGYQRGSLKQSDCTNRLSLAQKLMKKSSWSNIGLMRGKQNQGVNSLSDQKQKNVVTNHSFNGYFKENSEKMRKQMEQQIVNKIQSSQSYFQSSTKLSNYHFQSSSNMSLNDMVIHDEVRIFISKYFSQSSSHCQQLMELSEQYVSIEDFVSILFEEFQHLIGRQVSGQFGNEFAKKVFVIFGGQNVYFGDLYEKTSRNGLTGLIFQIVKSINQDKSKTNCGQLQVQSRMSINKSNHPPLLQKQQQQTILPIPLKSIISSKNANLYKNSQFTRSTNNTEKISLNKFFGTNSTSTSKLQFPITEQSKSFFDESTILYLDQNLQEVKKILSDYVEAMYEEAQMKLNKKYSQQIRKISLKYKDTERLLDKINQKISTHYDTLEMQKQFERKSKEMTDKQNLLLDKIKKLQYELKQSKDETQKQKLNSTKLEHQFTKIKEKLEKYENAIFEKAMQKESSQNSINNRVNQNINMAGAIFSQQNLPVYVDKGPQLEVKIDTFTEHSRPVFGPLVHSPSYVSYFGRQTDGSITPMRSRQNPNPNRLSISPIKQRISFVKGQNPPLNSTNPSSQTKGINIHKEGNSSQVKSIVNHSNPISYSPLKVQFCTSQVGRVDGSN